MGSRCLWGDNGLEEEGELGDMHMGLTGRSQVSRVRGVGCSYQQGSGTKFLAGGLFLLPSVLTLSPQ